MTTEKPPFKHYLITRYSVASTFARRKKIWLDEEWLETRLHLFKSYCLPSVTNQSCRSFTWLLLMDHETPTAAKLGVLSEVKKSGLAFEMVETNGNEWEKNLQGFVRQRNDSHLITTRLDSDDAIHRLFIETVQREFSGGSDIVLAFYYGLTMIIPEGTINEKNNMTNPFISKFEKADDVKTVFDGSSHFHLQMKYLTKLASLRQAWLQVIHGGNAKSVAGSKPASANLGDFGLR